MQKDERILALFEGKNVDYLPSQITFASRSRDASIAAGLGIAVEDLQSYLENHISWAYSLDDLPLFFCDNMEMMKELAKKDGFCTVDEEHGIVYDSWGLGQLQGENGVFICYGPMIDDPEKREMARPYMPEHLREVIDMPLTEAVKAYTIPDPLREGNTDLYKKALAENTDHMMVIPSGYSGIFERAYETVGFENFMVYLYEYPDELYELMEKITDCKIRLAKEKKRLGFKIFHHGDDLGTQRGPFFSPHIFETMILPHIKRLFAEVKKLDMYIVMHSCGDIIQYIPYLIDAGLDGLEPVQPCMDFRKLKQEFGQDLVLWGGINTQALPRMTPDQVVEMVRDTVSVLGKGGKHIIAPSQELLDDVPLENVIAVVKTIREMREMVM